MRCLSNEEINHHMSRINSSLIKRNLIDDFAGHDLYHHARVALLSLELMKKESIPCDSLALLISALLHDVHRLMSKDLVDYVTPVESIPIVLEIIEESSSTVTSEQRDLITECIKRHDDYVAKKEEESDCPELLLLQDADNLDALGLIGFVRTIQYGARLKKPFFSSSAEENFNIFDYQEGSHISKSTVEHIRTKLLSLQSVMSTATAKNYAEERIIALTSLIREVEKGWTYGAIS